MPVNAPRLRTWFAAALGAVILLVAGFYLYARLQARLTVAEIPKRLGIEIQQSTQGFTLSKSEGGHTLYTIHAARTTQFKQNGLAQLEDVNVVIYGRESNRFDRVYGKDFEYDPQSGGVTSIGVVHIDLQANPAGSNHGDQDEPPILKEPLHVTTTGLVFNTKTGNAVTKQRVEFRSAQASGYADGATYDSQQNQLLLDANVHMTTGGDRQVNVVAASGVLSKQPHQAILYRARMERQNTTTDAGQLTLFLREDNSVDHAVAVGGVKSVVRGTSLITVTAPEGILYLTGQKNDFERADLSGGTTFQSEGTSRASGSADDVHIAFGEHSLARKIEARGHVHLVQTATEDRRAAHKPASGMGAAQQTELFSDAMDFWMKSGKYLDRAETLGPGRMLIVSAPPEKLPPPKQLSSGEWVSWRPAITEVRAERFHSRFDAIGRIAAMHGDRSQVWYETYDQPVRESRSRDLDAAFTPDGQIASLVQKGQFYFAEYPCPRAAGCKAAAERQAWADTANYIPATGLLTLTGSPRVVDGGMTTTARRVTMDRVTGESTAEQDVKTTYSELKPQPGGALLASSDPIHVTSRTMTAERAAGVAHYEGNARLWQGANIVEGNTIDFDRNRRTMVAKAGAADGPHKLVHTVLLRQENSGKQSPVHVTSAQLTYVDLERVAHFDGGVIMTGSDGVTTADHADVYLRARNEGEASKPGVAALQASQLDHIVATGDVHMQQPTRQAWGDKLVYLAAQDQFVLTGKGSHVFDAQRGNTWGDSLTFYNRDGRVLVEGTPTHRTLTETRVSK